MRPLPPPRPPAPLPPPSDGPSPALRAQLERDFGSMEDLHRALRRMLSDPRRGGCVSLVCAPDGRLRLVHTPPDAAPRGTVLLRFPCPAGPRPPQIDWRAASERYERQRRCRPPYPVP